MPRGGMTPWPSRFHECQILRRNAVTEERQTLGRLGENLARAYLKKHGYRILATNYRTSSGEVDIVAYDHGILAFVEVKTRTSLQFGTPDTAITPRKMRQISSVARRYMTRHRLDDVSWRFDCVYVMVERDARPTGLKRILHRIFPSLHKPPAEMELIRGAFDLDSLHRG